MKLSMSEGDGGETKSADGHFDLIVEVEGTSVNRRACLRFPCDPSTQTPSPRKLPFCACVDGPRELGCS